MRATTPAASACSLEFRQREAEPLVRRDLWISERATTNNRMALRSVIESMTALSRKGRRFRVSFTHRLAVHRGRDGEVGPRLGEARVDPEERPDRKPGALASGGRSRRGRTRSTGAGYAATPATRRTNTRTTSPSAPPGDQSSSGGLVESGFRCLARSPRLAKAKPVTLEPFPDPADFPRLQGVTDGSPDESVRQSPQEVIMGKVFLLGVAIVVGYFIGYRDARNHSEHIVTRSVAGGAHVFWC